MYPVETEEKMAVGRKSDQLAKEVEIAMERDRRYRQAIEPAESGFPDPFDPTAVQDLKQALMFLQEQVAVRDLRIDSLLEAIGNRDTYISSMKEAIQGAASDIHRVAEYHYNSPQPAPRRS